MFHDKNDRRSNDQDRSRGDHDRQPVALAGLARRNQLRTIAHERILHPPISYPLLKEYPVEWIWAQN
jgi:hypothetical protein